MQIDLLREQAPELFQASGELLLVGDKPGRNSLAQGLKDAGHRVTLFESRRSYTRVAVQNQAFAKVLEGDLRSLSAIASLNGLQWDYVVWWNGLDMIRHATVLGALREMQLVARKLVVVGVPHPHGVQRDLELGGFQLSSDTTVGKWYGAHWVLQVPVSVPLVAPVPPASPVLAGGKVTAIIVSFNTAVLTQDAVATLRQAYPDLQIILIDNGSLDGTKVLLPQLAEKYQVRLVYNSTNVGHGPALHQGIVMASTPYVLTFDSDCTVHKGGFIEAMLARFARDPVLYAVGWLRFVDRHSGVPLEWHLTHPPASQFCRYTHPSCALIDRAKYLTLPPAIHHGAPLLENMRGAVDAGLHLEDFLVSAYVEHLTAGTRRIYGGKWGPLTGEARGQWRATDRLPI